MTSPTRFDPIIQAVTRRAEDIYAKMGIKRDESEDLARKKKEGGDNEAHSIPWEDTTEVSILALRGFLEDLLGKPTITAQPTPPPMAEPATNIPPHNTMAAKAANAYNTTGHIVHDKNVEPPRQLPPHSETAVTLGNDFGEEEKSAIRGYIQDMEALESRGITILTLRRSLTFLESIHQAIEDLK